MLSEEDIRKVLDGWIPYIFDREHLINKITENILYKQSSGLSKPKEAVIEKIKQTIDGFRWWYIHQKNSLPSEIVTKENELANQLYSEIAPSLIQQGREEALKEMREQFKTDETRNEYFRKYGISLNGVSK